MRTIVENVSTNLTASGYGVSKKRLYEILNKLTDEDISELIYNCHRTSEKLGYEYFESSFVVEESKDESF